jgi:aminoglycoside phosphotransferase family enzyme/predicted kinase
LNTFDNHNLSPLIAAMLRPEFYPHNPSKVELRQTHISYVILTGPYVYKIKKPVKFNFLDYSTLENRRHFCDEEARLNRRLAPNTYLGTVGICRAQGSFYLDEKISDRQRIVEYAVKMNRLPEDRMLTSLIRDESVKPEHIAGIAQKLAAFHKKAAIERSARYGSPQAIASRVRDNFQETRRFIGYTLGKNAFETIQDYSEGFLTENSELLQRRVAEGRVREGHGDLRAEHVCLFKDIEIFDCIEFDEALRYGDVASEIGFLSMDLDFFGEADFSAKLENSYASAARDPGLAALLPFYKCYRAYVRGKVESLKHEETDVAEPEQREAALQAMQYFLLATRYAKGSGKPMLLIVCGMVASGKSTVARLLSARTGFPVIDSDRVRKKLAGISPTTRARDGYQSGIYTEDFTRLTYESLLKAADNRLANGQGVIIDATFGNPKHRRLFTELARRYNVPLLFIECRTDENTIRQRLKNRQDHEHEVSDATYSVYERLRADYRPIVEIPDSCRFELDTERELLAGITRLEAKLEP